MNKKFRTAPTLRAAVVLTATSSLSACLDLDSFVMNPRHCSVGYSDDDCALKKMCTPCDEAYPFADFGLPAATARRQPIRLADGETNDAWFFPSSGGALADTTIVFSHGNFGSLEHYLNRAGLLWATGANVFAVDYRGFGQSSDTSEASEVDFMNDAGLALALVPDVLAENGLDPGQPIALYGYSAGALSAVEMAVHTDPRGSAGVCTLILEAPWGSVDAFAADSSFIGLPGSFVTTGPWDNISKLRDFSRPYLQLHGTEDLTVRLEIGQQVFAAVGSLDKRLITVDGAAHGNFLGVVKDTVLADVPAVMGKDTYVQVVTEQIAAHCR